MKEQKAIRPYKCAVCGGVFNCGLSEEEANAECYNKFGIKNASTDSSLAVVCDDCFKMMEENERRSKLLARS